MANTNLTNNTPSGASEMESRSGSLKQNCHPVGRPLSQAPLSSGCQLFRNRCTRRRTPILLRYRFQSCISLLLATCVVLCPLAQDLGARPLPISKMGVSFQIVPPQRPVHKGFLEGITGNWSAQPKIQNLNVTPSISGRLGFSLTGTARPPHVSTVPA